MTARGIHTCCPEAPSTINITQQIIQLDGATSLFYQEAFTGLNVNEAQDYALRYTPYSSASVTIVYNTNVLEPNRDYTVFGSRLHFLFDPDDTAIISARYLVVGEGVSTMADSAIAVGTLVGYGSEALPPDGWLVMNGSTQVSNAGYPALYNFLQTNGHLVTVPGMHGDPFTLKFLPSSYYDGTTLVSGTTIIKT